MVNKVQMRTRDLGFTTQSADLIVLVQMEE